MLIILKSNEENDVARVEAKILAQGLNPVFIESGEESFFVVTGETQYVDAGLFSSDRAVKRIVRLKEVYPLAARRYHPDDTKVSVADVNFSDFPPVFIAGPCAVESEEQLYNTAIDIKMSGASILRAGAYKPRSSPYSFQGLGREGLKIISKVKESVNMPVASEITDISQLDAFYDIDLIQIGARNMQNYELLKQLAKTEKPLLLKRSPAASIDDWLESAEYLLSGGCKNLILCERGIRTFETHTRNSLDIAVIPVMKKLTHLPVVIDPSHSSGSSEYVAQVTYGAVAAGCDGVMIEVHNNPEIALSDGKQAVTCEEFKEIISKSYRIKSVL